MMKRKYQSLLIIFFIILISIPVILPFLHKGYFPTHDGEWAVVRMGDMFRSLRDHQFPVRYSGNLNFGYGYPLFNFTYPAPYYIGTGLHFFKFGFVDSVKILFLLSVIFSGIAMYLASKELWRNKIAGIISAIFYIYLPYRIVDLYARGSIGESLSFIFFPLILYFTVKILDDSRFKIYMLFASISYALLIATHNIMAVLFTPVLLIFILFRIVLSKKSKDYLTILFFMLLSYGLSAFFWLPALLEKHNILLSQIPIADRNIYFVTIQQLLLPRWGYGLPDHPDGFSYQIGPAHAVILVLLILSLLFLWFKKRKSYKEITNRIAAVFTIVTIILTLFMFSFTAPIWKITPLLREINYPWTLLAVIGFLIALLAGFLWLQNKFMRYAVIGLGVLVVIFVFPHAKPEYYFDKGDAYYLTNEATTTSSQELMPLWVKKNPIERSVKKVEILNGGGEVSNMLTTSKRINFSVNIKARSWIRVNTIYWPGWEAFVDDKLVSISYNNSAGLIEFLLPEGKHDVQVRFGETPTRYLADAISLLSFLVLVILGIAGNKLSSLPAGKAGYRVESHKVKKT